MRLFRLPALFLGVQGFVAIALTTPALAQGEKSASLTLESLLEAGERNYPSLAKKPLLEESLRLSRSRANRSYLPRLSLGGQATWQSDVTSVNIPIPGAKVTPPPKDQYRATLDLQQTIWDGGVTRQQKDVLSTRSQIEGEKVNLEWYQVRGNIVHLFFAGLVAQELLMQSQALEGRLANLVKQSQVALANGMVTQRDVLLIQARQLEAKQASADARARLWTVKRSLQELTSLALADDTQLRAGKSRCDATSDEVNRPELKLLAAQSTLLDKQEKLDRSGDRPRLGAFATGGYGRPGLNFLNNTFEFYFIGGVSLTVPLSFLYSGTWQNGARQTKIQRSILAQERERVLKQVEVDLASRDTELARLDAILAIDDELVQVREKASEQTEKQFTMGTVSMSDLINDLTQEDQARSKREIHRAERNLACHEQALIRGDL
jgi:outer membrane protein TolC